MWLIYSLLAAVTNTAGSLFKKVGSDSVNAVVLAWFTRLVSIPIALSILFFDNSEQNLTPTFWITTLSASLLAAIASVLLFKAMEHSDLSSLAPYFTLIPAFMMLSSFLILGEVPSIVGAVGVLLIVAGAYHLNSHSHQKPLDPFRYLVKNRGAKYMMLIAIIWSITTNLSKIATRDVSPQFLIAANMIIIAIILSVPVAASHRKDIIPTVHRHKKVIFFIALFSVLTLLFEVLAIQTQLVSYTFAIRRIDVLLTILVGGYFLHEKHILRKIEGAIPMVVGAILILFA